MARPRKVLTLQLPIFLMIDWSMNGDEVLVVALFGIRIMGTMWS